ncbi:DUF454 family protein [Christensenellaceae bacterium NSJ-44]|uniref:DUF454 family protein n=1 Tax=Luoshenia tenuis TaxID=2763654 RepID=A0A926CXU7_9FIRM|nr:DUF454 family protein [Luoshenia tenuis]
MKIRKVIYVALGCIGLGLGAVGAVLPLLPAFPFLLLAAFCFAKSSQRLHDWFLATKLYKNNLESYVKGRGMTWKTKLRIMAIVTATMAVGFIMMERVPVGRIILAGVWVFHILYFIFGVKTLSPQGMQGACRVIKVGGMHCEDCAKKLECAFNETGHMTAQADWTRETITVHLREPLPNTSLIQIVNRAGYRAEAVWEMES